LLLPVLWGFLLKEKPFFFASWWPFCCCLYDTYIYSLHWERMEHLIERHIPVKKKKKVFVLLPVCFHLHKDDGIGKT